MEIRNNLGSDETYLLLHNGVSTDWRELNDYVSVGYGDDGEVVQVTFRNVRERFGTANPTGPELFLHLLSDEEEFPEGLVERESFGSTAAAGRLREVLESEEEERRQRLSDILLHVDVEELEHAQLLRPLLPWLLANLDSSDSERAFLAAEKVGGTGDPRAIPKLIELTRRNEGAERIEAVVALGKLKIADDCVVSRLIELLKDQHLCAQAIESLGELGPNAAKAAPELIRFASGRGWLATQARESLRKIGVATTTSGQEVGREGGHIPQAEPLEVRDSNLDNREKESAEEQTNVDTREALRVVQSLAEGRCPVTGTTFPPDSPYRHADVVHALLIAARALEREDDRLPEHVGKWWDSKEEQQLCEEFAAGKSIEEIAQIHQRKPKGIRSRLVRFGKIARQTREEDNTQLRNEFAEGQSISEMARKHNRSEIFIRTRLVRLGLMEDRWTDPRRPQPRDEVQTNENAERQEEARRSRDASGGGTQ
jgi:uncharacterized protein YuzE/Mor family transcriptional regulator/DNA-binding CsgD family transcriptional regulator